MGIVGQLDDTVQSIKRKTSNKIHSYFDIQGSKVPVFQTPHRSPMPSPIPKSATLASTHPNQLTPEIGEAKDIHKPVVGPVVVDVNGAVRDKPGPLLTPSFSPSVPSSYLHYQPGVHSVARPPPPLIARPGRGETVGLVSPHLVPHGCTRPRSRHRHRMQVRHTQRSRPRACRRLIPLNHRRR